jgi:hypothetical protein
MMGLDTAAALKAKRPDPARRPGNQASRGAVGQRDRRISLKPAMARRLKPGHPLCPLWVRSGRNDT